MARISSTMLRLLTARARVAVADLAGVGRKERPGAQLLRGEDLDPIVHALEAEVSQEFQQGGPILLVADEAPQHDPALRQRV